MAERQQYLTMAVRDFLNEGGKLDPRRRDGAVSGPAGHQRRRRRPLLRRSTATRRPSASSAGRRLLRGLPDPGRRLPPVLPRRLRAHEHRRPAGRRAASPTPINGFEGAFGGPVVAGDNPLDEAGFFQPTSDVLPVGEFPQFASRGAAEYQAGGSEPVRAGRGQRYAGAVHADASYMRLTKTVDLTGGDDAPQLQFQLSLNTEAGYDHFIVEAHTAARTTGRRCPRSAARRRPTRRRSATTPASCSRCIRSCATTSAAPDCASAGTSGTWNAITGSTDGWQQVAYDLSAFAGQQVEVVAVAT